MATIERIRLMPRRVNACGKNNKLMEYTTHTIINRGVNGKAAHWKQRLQAEIKTHISL